MKKLFLIALMAGFATSAMAQFKFGPTVDLGFGFYSKTSDKINLKGGIAPSFGLTFDKYVNYWLTARAMGLYSFQSLKTERVSDGKIDHMNAQGFDVSLAGRFSNFDDDTRTLPYGAAGLGLMFNIVSKGQESYMQGCTYNKSVPYFTVGAGTGIKMSFFSEMDFSVNFRRYLSPMFTNPIDGKDARLNEVSIKVAALF